MRSMTSIALAAATSLLCAVQADAAVYTGWNAVAGTLRTTMNVSQISNASVTATLPLTVYRCDGTIDYPVFVMVNANSCVAVGVDYEIRATVLNNTQTSFRIAATAVTCGIRRVTIGSTASRCGFDLTLPNPGTPGSGQGLNPTSGAAGLVGMWNASINLDGAVILAGNPLIGDLYSRLTVSFSACFDDGDVFEFKVDTDKL